MPHFIPNKTSSIEIISELATNAALSKLIFQSAIDIHPIVFQI
jgi:hypothetical protein